MLISDCSSVVCSSDLRVAAFHLVAERVGDIVEPEQAIVGRYLAMEYDLEQQIAKLIADRSGVAAGDRVGNLIGFFDGIGRDGREILREIPLATAVGIAPLAHDAEQAIDGGRRSEEQRVGKEYVSTCRSRGSPAQKKT